MAGGTNRIKKRSKKKPVKLQSIRQLMKNEGKKIAKKPEPVEESSDEILSSESDSQIVFDARQEEPQMNCKIYEIRRNAKSDPTFMELGTSTERAEAAFKWMIDPLSIETFYEEHFEKEPFVITTKGINHFGSLLSTKEIHKILDENYLYFGKNIDLTTYENGERQTHNKDGRALPAVVWDAYQERCSVRLLNPQTYSKNVYELCSVLAEFFSSFVGANVYLTPPDSQGFAPHWDDIDAFVIQLEGTKRWRLYNFLTDDESLPLESSVNLSPDEVGSHFFEYELQAGDIMYIPRGVVHEARCQGMTHSLHITISVNQKNTWGDFLKVYFPIALDAAIANDKEFRKCLPRDYMSRTGFSVSPTNAEFEAKIKKLISKMLRITPDGTAFDHMASTYFKDALPPVLSKEEEAHSSRVKALWSEGGPNDVTLKGDSKIRLAGQNVCRIVPDGEKFRLFFTTDNTKVYREHEDPLIEIEDQEALAVNSIIQKYPDWLKVEELNFSEDVPLEDKIDLATMLYLKGIILAKD